MNKTILSTAVALSLLGAGAAQAASWTGGFDMYQPDGVQMDANGAKAGNTALVTGAINYSAPDGTGTFTLASTDKFSGLNWTASGGISYAAGTHTININGDGADCIIGNTPTLMPCETAVPQGDVTWTTGAGQVGGNINFSWGGTNGIDVFLVWDVFFDGTDTIFTSTDFDGDTILGKGMEDGPFPSFNANFNMVAAGVDLTPVPVPAAVWLFGSGLVGLAGIARRRKA